MLPVLLNKVMSTLWRMARGQPQPAGRRGFAGGKKRVNLALQGGGAHGAFTWGVLDELLSDGRLAIDGISGASAGAVNAVVLADGLARGGPEQARRQLAEFWRAASFGGALPELQRIIIERLFAFVPRPSVPMPWLGTLARYWSPYDLNPLNINPLKDLIEGFVDFERLRGHAGPELFISATNVHSGAPRVFSRAEITAEAVMASACLPLMFHAVEIDGVPYWDGGYSGNPTVLPFLHATRTEDVLIVQINPRERDGAPTSARDITLRLNELTFNAALLSELRTLELAERLIDEGGLPRGTGPGEYRRIRLHRIVMDTGPAFHDRGRMSNDYDFFKRLSDLGREAARQFLIAHFDDIGRRSTMDVEAEAEATPEVA
jgi:NTE family protein